VQINWNWHELSEIHQEPSSSSSYLRNSSTKCDHEGFWGEKKSDRSNCESVKRKKKITDLFSVPELTRSFNKDLLFEPPRKPGNPRKNLFVFIAKAQRSSTNRNKRWVEEELRKRFEELRNETLKMWIFKDSPFISWNEAYNHHK
jgi:hypothetical protein